MDRHRLGKLGTVVLSLLAFMGSGCGLLTIERTIFPTQVFDATGQPISVEDLQQITQDFNLSRDEMVQALRDLGVENEELIQAIVDDGLGG